MKRRFRGMKRYRQRAGSQYTPSGSKPQSSPPPGGDDWGGGNPVALASSTFCRFTSARLAPAPVRIKEGGVCPLPPSGSKSQLPTTKSWTTGAGGIQWLLQVAPSVVSPQLVLLPLPSGSKKVGMPPPPVILAVPVRIKAGGDPVKKSIAFSL